MPQARRVVTYGAALLALCAGVGWSGGAAAARTHKRRSRGGARAHPVVVVPPLAPRVPVAVVAPAPPLRSNPGFGRVQFVTDHRAYLDRGAADGLVVGQSLLIARGVRAIGTCRVETAGDHEATCVGGRLRVGDAFRTPRGGGRKARTPAPVMAAIVDDKTLELRAVQVAEGTIEKVDFNGRRAFRSHGTAEATPGFATWFSQPDGGGGTYVQERIDGIVRGVEIGNTGFRFDGAFSAMRWNTPVATTRFRPDTPTQFYLWEAEASRRLQDGGATVAVGRLWPFHTPGLTLLDGIQLGRQNEARTAEGGLYGGLIPSAEGLVPTFDIWTAGLYGALTQLGAGGVDRTLFRLAREEARVSVWHDAAVGAVAEAQGFAQAWIGPVSAGGGGRVRWATEQPGGHPVIELAHVDLGVRPTVDSAAGLHLRYVGASLLSIAPLRAEVPMLNGALHAIADAHLNLSSRLVLGASAGAHREGDTGLHQIHAGAELRLPRLFGETGGLWFGGTVEQGWMQGETLYAQFVGYPGQRFQVLARLSADGTRFETPTAITNLNELGGYLSVDGALGTRMRLRAWSMLRAPIFVQGELPVETSVGGVFGLSLAGSI